MPTLSLKYRPHNPLSPTRSLFLRARAAAAVAAAAAITRVGDAGGRGVGGAAIPIVVVGAAVGVGVVVRSVAGMSSDSVSHLPAARTTSDVHTCWNNGTSWTRCRSREHSSGYPGGCQQLTALEAELGK